MGVKTRTIANNLTSGLGAAGGGLYTSIAHFQSHFDFTITTSQTAMDFGATEYISDANDFSIDANKKIVTIANAGRYECHFTGLARVSAAPTNEDDWSQVYIYGYKNGSTFIQEARTEFGPMSKIISTAENTNDTGKSIGACSFVYQFAANDTIQWKVEYLGDSTNMKMSNRNFIIKRLS
tara:strand:- start:200 stop:739 length:540 start_codon:yes stop_codon:yes gene_type:complete